MSRATPVVGDGVEAGELGLAGSVEARARVGRGAVMVGMLVEDVDQDEEGVPTSIVRS